MPSADWRIYYDDFTIFDSEDGSWESAPPDGVIAVAWRDGERSDVLRGGEHYVRFPDDGTIEMIDLDPFLRGPHLAPGRLKFGRATSKTRHERIIQQAWQWLRSLPPEVR